MKRVFALIWASTQLIAVPLGAQAPWRVLEGVSGVSPVVRVHLPPEVSLLESDYEGQLQWVLESQLRLAGIPLLEPSGEILLWVDINAMDSGDGVVFAYTMELQEPAILKRRATEDAGTEACWVVSWHFGGVAQTDLDKLDLALREVVSELANGFTMDWTAANHATDRSTTRIPRSGSPRSPSLPGGTTWDG
ncbi:hypothetical protein ACFL3S_07575 [Gemmatimonadota bacterium]